MSAVQAVHPEATVELWAQDEHRLGLLPVVRRVWAPRGQRPTTAVRRRYQWLSAYGFVRPATGATWWCLLPTVSLKAFALAFAEFARDEGIGPTRRVVLAVDRAGWHTSRRLRVPAGIHLAFLPPYSPELQPAERLWPLLNEPVANRTFADLDALEDVLVTRCQTLAADAATVQTHTHCHWWPIASGDGTPSD